MWSRVLLLSSLIPLAGASIVTSTDARLPMSLSTVIKDLEAEGCHRLTPVCLITSQSVTVQEKENLQRAILGDFVDAKRAVGSANGIALALPGTIPEVTSTAVVCEALIYYPSAVDLSREEGLYSSLAPAMERLLALGRKGSLIIVSESTDAKARIESTIGIVLANLVADKPVSSLSDVFDKIMCVTPSQVVQAVTQEIGHQQDAADAVDTVAKVVAQDSSLWFDATQQLGASDLAAARLLGPAARRILAETVAAVRSTASDKLVPNFGDLCDAAMARALMQFDDSAMPAVAKSSMARQIRSHLEAQLSSDLTDLFDEQVDLLQADSFDEFKKGLSKLIVSPNLGTNMAEVTKKSVSSFTRQAQQLVAKKSNWSAEAAKSTFATKLKDYYQTRLLNAQAGGQFRPLPRKGVTVGLHWLLPKPFGNDYRQEPWLHHATDNMVYVPRDKITELSKEEVKSGDWRNKIVPSPIGNDMIYMQ